MNRILDFIKHEQRRARLACGAVGADGEHDHRQETEGKVISLFRGQPSST